MRNQSTYNPPITAPKKTERQPSRAERGAYLLSYFMIRALITLLSLIVILTLISILTSGTIFGEVVSEKIPIWFAAVLILALYTIIVLPLKALRYYTLPHKSYALYPSQHTPSKYGDATLWLLLFILLGWYLSEHQGSIAQWIQHFPEWWRNFVDTAGAWLYK